jgi:hypothetical protein
MTTLPEGKRTKVFLLSLDVWKRNKMTDDGFALIKIKIIKSKRHIKNRHIGNFMHMSIAAAVFCILYCIL